MTRTVARPRPRLGRLAAAVALWPCLAWPAALTDGSVGAVQSLSGTFTVPQSLGSLRGANLFHSFTRFGVAGGEAATFTTTDPGIRHVISRVTGGEASLFDGPLRLEAAAGSSPSFWFFNPGGIAVGAGARFDLPASLHLSTATQLQFADGSSWDARAAAGGSSLSVAAPERFGLVGAQAPAALRWRDSDLILQPGHALELSGGSLSVERSTLAAPGGRVALQSPADVQLTDGALLYASAGSDPGSGSIRIDAGSLTLDRRGGSATGLLGQTLPGTTAQGAGIELRVAGELRIVSGAEIRSESASDQPAGRIGVRAGTLAIDGGSAFTGIASTAFGAGAGAAIDVDVAQAATIGQRGQIYTATFGAGDGGALALRAGSLTVDGRGVIALVGTQSLGDATGSAGRLQVQARQALSVVDAGRIRTETEGGGAAGPIDVGAGSMRLDGGPGGRPTGVFSSGAAPLHVTVDGSLEVAGGAGISSENVGSLPAGELRVQARTVVLDGGGTSAAQIDSSSWTALAPAPVVVEAGERLLLNQGGQIRSWSLGSGDAGSVTVRAPTLDLTGGGEFVTTLSSVSWFEYSGNAGVVSIEASNLTLRSGARIDASTLSRGGTAGQVSVLADRIVLDGAGVASGIDSYALNLDAGHAGTVRVQAREQLTVRDGASIMAGTLGSGSPGRIVVATPTLLVDGKGAPDTFTGIAGDVIFGNGAGADVSVEASRITVRDGGGISTSTFSRTDAGSLHIAADVLTLDGGDGTHSTHVSADTGAAGRGGNLTIDAREVSVVNSALISTSAFAGGPGGALRIAAQRLTVDGSAAIVSVAAGSGAAGRIELRVDDAMVLRGGGALSANTAGAGAAGRIDVAAGSLQVSGSDPATGFRSSINSRARAESGGQPGSVTIDVRGELQVRDGAQFNIANDARVADPAAVLPTALTVRAGSVHLADAVLTAAAGANADAGRISLASAGPIRLDRSDVRTSAVDGNGGPIALSAGGVVRLKDSGITTSVTGARNGNGGDIAIDARALLLQSGFVQANTAAPQARGGDVRVAVGLLVPDGSTLFVGGSRIEEQRRGVSGYNVIQAAAPEGVSGTLDLTLPQLNLSGSLAGLAAPRIDFGALQRDVCAVGDGNSLGLLGRGALSEPASAPQRIDP